MIPAQFEYKRASSLEEALNLMNDDSNILAGGHSLIPAMKLRLNQPGRLIDISKIKDICQIKEEEDSVIIGAGVTHRAIANSEIIQNHCNMISEGAKVIGDLQVRNKGTLGGSLAHADPAADWPAMMIAIGAEIETLSKDGSRKIPAEEFFTGFFSTALNQGELIKQVRIPKLKQNQKACYKKFEQPASRFAIVGCAIVLTIDNKTISNAVVAFTGVSDAAYRDEKISDYLIGKSLNKDTINTAANELSEDISFSDDHYASEEYRKHIAKVYVKKTLQSCK